MKNKVIQSLACLFVLSLGSIQAQQSAPSTGPTPTPIPTVPTLASPSVEAQKTIVRDDRVDALLERVDQLQQEITVRTKNDDLKTSLSRINDQITNLEGSVGKNRSALSTVGSSMRPADVIWISLCAALVFFMQPGFCLLELGFSRSKNVINVIMKNFVDFCISSLGYVLVGFGLMYGTSVLGIFGSSHFFLLNGAGDDGIWVFLIYQMMFVGTSATIASGAMAERTKFSGYILFSIVLSTVIYPITGHWGWGGHYNLDFGQGWLAALGFIDFAGATVVHSVGGACALAGIIVLGPRVGRFAADGSSRLIVGHNLPFAACDAFYVENRRTSRSRDHPQWSTRWIGCHYGMLSYHHPGQCDPGWDCRGTAFHSGIHLAR